MKPHVLLFAVAAVALPSAALAQVPDKPSAPTASKGPEITLAAGLRGMLLPSAGLQPYASGNDLMASSSVSLGVTLFRVGAASMVASVEWDWGSRSDSARGQDASLTLHRLAGALETRWQPARRLYLSLKLSPAAYAVLGSITAPNLDRPLVARPWTWGVDTTAGAGLLLGTVGDWRSPAARFWLTGEMGYAFAGSVAMNYTPASSDTAPRHFGTLMMPAFKPSGGVGRLGLAVSF